MVVLMVAAATALRSEPSAKITPSTPLNYLSHRGACSDQRGCFFEHVRLDCTTLIMTTRPPPPHPTASPSVSALRGEAWLAHMLICRQHQWLSVPLHPLTLSPPLNIPLRFHFLLPYRFRSDTPQLENKGGWMRLRRGGLQEESLRGVTELIRERFTYRDNERIERRMRKGGGRQRQNENLHCRVLITTWLKQA